ncbi:helix-turn-helix domain-containing protein [Candidatus Cetobacterium colombiensis]|uniref:Insertion element IS150 protein InsJ-like helix-turn-helix domain-containing protein n=1 Tax=Candidatus Cetobacterium colombiensis TaxID=3073100 RepID=A0ABU4WDE5_9FUSO|nr:hypothetical protein [Candidatus Cetobacterium colombiensis]MDX8337042.1 hypothetical protein [Candidatus Cetobacterium colombiensis]
MGKKSKFSVREKEKIVLRFLKNEISANYICEYFKVNRYVLNKWVRRYCAHGIVGLEDSKGWAIIKHKLF